MARKRDSIFLDEPSGGKRGPGGWIATVLGGGVLIAVGAWMVYTQFRIDVPTGHMAILIHKSGRDLANADEVAPDADHKGVQKDFLIEGRYFRNPFSWDWEVIPQTVIENGKFGVRVSLAGDDLPYGEFLAKVDKDGNPTTKGVMPGVLNPGRHPIHPWLFSVELHEPVTVPAGFKGVVTNLAGPLAKDPNKLLVEAGFRGVQEEALDPGTYYVNPYETRISLIDCRSQRFNLAENKDMGFPSKDGFWVSLDGIIEFRVKPERAAEIYVVYNEVTNGERIDEELIKKVIMPNARSICRLQGSNESGREFITGDTRSLFQEHFQSEMRKQCDPLGVEVIQAVITRIRPPEKIADPVRKREIAKQQQKQYVQQILQQESEQKLIIEQELVKQKEALVKADQQVIKLTTEAKQQQEVAVTKAEERLGVAQFKLDAAKDEAAAVLAKGKAEADVIRFQNEADAAGWKQAVEAFSGNGGEYARYVMLQKLSPAYRRIMANTADSPIMRIFESFAPRNEPGPTPRTAGAADEAPTKPVSRD